MYPASRWSKPLAMMRIRTLKISCDLRTRHMRLFAAAGARRDMWRGFEPARQTAFELKPHHCAMAKPHDLQVVVEYWLSYHNDKRNNGPMATMGTNLR
jgi:hypothetical protein